MTVTESRTQRAARQYLERGWCAIPVPAGSKNPNRSEWEKERYEPADVSRKFPAGGNLGIHCGEPSNGLVDVDLDCAEARVLAFEFLPPTDRVHGRPTNPGSHWWYIADPIPEKVRRFKDTDAKTLLELRTTGGQTLVPPSIHDETGEEYTWEAKGEATAIDGRVLQHQVRKLASCTLLARHWNEGSRHDLALSVAGALLRHGWGEDETVSFIVAAATAAGDSKQVPEHRQAVIDTADELRRNQAATGIPTLIDILGERVARKLLDWLDIRVTQPTIIMPGESTTNGKHDEPEIEVVEKTPDEPSWAIPDEAPAVAVSDLPYWLERLTRHVEPFTVMFPDDWPVMMTLPFWSILWPSVRIQNLNLALWTLGISTQGVGKNHATDELIKVIRAAADTDVMIYTSGSPEGIMDRLGGNGKQMLAYHDEYGGFLKTMNRDYMAQAKQSFCSLYDGRIASHWRAQKQDVLVIDPVVAVVATTTPSDLQNYVDPDDLLSGYLSRFMFCVPDRRRMLPKSWVASENGAREQLAREINSFRNQLRGVTRLEFESSVDGRDPEVIQQFIDHRQMDTGELVKLEDEMHERSIPAGRLLARIKKISGLLALAERSPMTSSSGRTVTITDEHLAMASVIVERGAFYASRAMAWIGVNEEVRLSDRALQLLMQEKNGLTQRDLCRRLHAKSAEMHVALSLLRDGGQAIDTRVEGSRAVRWHAIGLRGTQ